MLTVAIMDEKRQGAALRKSDAAERHVAALGEFLETARLEGDAAVRSR